MVIYLRERRKKEERGTVKNPPSHDRAIEKMLKCNHALLVFGLLVTTQLSIEASASSPLLSTNEVRRSTGAATTSTATKTPLKSSSSFLRTTTTIQKLPPSITQQSKGGDYGPDNSGCAPGCDYVNGFKCCGSKCNAIEMPCE